MSIPEMERIEKAVQLPAKEISYRDIYTLFYRTGNNPRPLEKHFLIPDMKDFRELINKFKEYCTNCGFRFVKIERFLSDMAEDERNARMTQ